MTFCFYGNLKSTLEGRPIGGGEKQIALLAKAIDNIGNKVFVVDLSATKDFIINNIEGISFINYLNKKPIVLRKLLKYYYLYNLFKLLNASIYYGRIRSFIHFIPYMAAKKKKKKFVLNIASDLDVGSFKERIKFFYVAKGLKYFLTSGLITEIFFRIIVKKADIVLAQTRSQIELLKKKRDLSFYFPNIVHSSLFDKSIEKKEDYFVYVGSFDRRKGSELFIKVVKENSDINFIVIGNFRDIKSSSILYLSNVKFLGRLDHESTLSYIAKSKALISTSYIEGFPNVFLEAWALGTPIISLHVNPDNIIEKYNLGIYCRNSIELLNDAISNFDFVENPENLRKFVYNYHNIDTAINKLISICNERAFLEKGLN